MSEQFSRTAMLFGEENMEKLYGSRVAVFGIGGVGGYCVEALCRTGIGAIDLFDNDRVCPSNLNRQIIATRSTLGRYKTDVMRERILDINPSARVGAYNLFYESGTAEEIDLSVYDYIVDAVDTMAAKLELVTRSIAGGIPVISSMGAANKLDAAAFEVSDIYDTTMCPMARIMRRELRKRGVSALKVVYSKEPPAAHLGSRLDKGLGLMEEQRGNYELNRRIPASNAFVPPVAGLIIAGEVVKDLTGLAGRHCGGK